MANTHANKLLFIIAQVPILQFIHLLRMNLMCITLRNNRSCKSISTFPRFFLFFPCKIWTAATPHDFFFFPQCRAVGAIVCALSVVLKLRVPRRLLPYKSSRASFRAKSTVTDRFCSTVEENQDVSTGVCNLTRLFLLAADFLQFYFIFIL